MAKSSYYLSQLTELQDDAGRDMMKFLMNNGLNKGITLKTQKGTFKIGVCQEKESGVKVLKILYVEKNVAFTHRTINPSVLLDIYEELEYQVR